MILKLFICCIGLWVVHGQDADDEIRMPPSIIEGPKDQDNVASSLVELICRVHGVPAPTIEWYVNGTILVTSKSFVTEFSENNQKLSVRLLKSDSTPRAYTAGTYHCIASNSYGVAVSRSANVGIVELKEFEVISTMPVIHAEVGQSIELTCNVPPSYPKPIVKWVLVKDWKTKETNVQYINTDARVSMDNNGNLIFSYVDMADDSGDRVYACEVQNYLNSVIRRGSPTRLKVKSKNLINRPPATKKTSGTNVLGLEGDNVDMFCIFSAVPAASVHWIKIGGPMPPHTTADGGTHLILSKVVNSDEYEGVYTCRCNNTLGSAKNNVKLTIQSSPKFLKKPMNTNVTEGGNVTFTCEGIGEPKPKVQWMVNNKPISTLGDDERRDVKGNTYFMKDLHRGGGGLFASDLHVVQCVISNAHGKEISSGYINVVKPLELLKPAEGTTVAYKPEFHTLVVLDCYAKSDPSMIPEVKWLKDNAPISYKADLVDLAENNSLLIHTMNMNQESDAVGKYTCIVSTQLQKLQGYWDLSFEGVAAIVTTAGSSDLWWIAILLAILLLIAIIILICCCLRRNKGESYLVDENERKQGNDPEKECDDIGYHDYTRQNQDPVKGSRASLNSSIHVDSDDDNDSMAEYGDIDTGKFNEDGSFIGQYAGTTEKKKPSPNYPPPPYGQADSTV